MVKALYTAQGCSRCGIVRQFLAEQKIEFTEQDIREAGKEAFKLFYKENRKQVRRGENGIEFPILHADGCVLQGIGPILSWIQTAGRLDPFIRSWDPAPGWLGGLNIFAATLPEEEAFTEIIRFVKLKGLKVELASDGRNPALLTHLADEGLVDRLLFILRGPSELYRRLTGEDLSEGDLAQSLSSLTSFPDYQITLPVAPVKRDDGTISYLTPEEAAGAAGTVETATRIKTHPFVIQAVAPDKESGLGPLERSDLFKYRTRCRRFMVKSEIG